MACSGKDCKKCRAYIMHVCRVCELTDGDTKEKRCCYCSFCEAYICKDCHTNWKSRVEAAFKDKVAEPLAELIKPVTELLGKMTSKGRKREETILETKNEPEIIPASDTETTA